MRLEVSGPSLFLAQLLVGFFEGLFGAIAFVAKALECFAQVAVLVGSFFGFVFPLLAALSEFGSRPVTPGVGHSGIRLTRIAKLRWLCTTKANGDRDRNGNVVTRSTFWARKLSLFGRFWTAYHISNEHPLAPAM
jgi:hypothetical protein